VDIKPKGHGEDVFFFLPGAKYTSLSKLVILRTSHEHPEIKEESKAFTFLHLPPNLADIPLGSATLLWKYGIC